ncbi:MAG: Chromosome partition protein smc [Parcubacteria group bacterium GW2011_GWB1_43_8]|nr:MAG: Chromosome partition protein smc [Parcubacteria group bacterium GW2011_GWB1_43_8]
MILKRLELSGFKSFAKTTVLQFPSAVAAVVGPNGSGKSNVAEALRWVLGEQSMKSLRGKKGEDLIFNGSQTAAKMGRASVSLIFDNKNKILPVDFEEVIITRLVHRSGENEYLINDSPVRLKDITELLGSVGLGASSHHIISQGEADRFLNASPKDRKEMIEEALGLKIYQIKKVDAEKRLEKTAENIKQVESLRREIQHQLKFLKKEAEKIEEAEKFKTELKNIYAQFIPQERDYLKRESDKIIAEKNKIVEEFKTAEKSRPFFHGESPTENARKTIKDIEIKLAKEESELGKSRSGRNALERELGKLEGIMEYRQLLSSGSSKSKGEPPPIPCLEVLEIIKAVQKSAILGAANSDIAEARKIFEEIASSTKEFIAKISGKQDNAVIDGNDASDLNKKKNEIQETIGAIEKQEKEIIEKVSKLKLEAEENRRKIAEMEKESYQAEAKLREIKGHLARLSLEEDKVKLRTDELKREEAEAVALLGLQFLESFAPTSRLNLDVELSYQEREKFLKQAERLKIKLEDCGAVGGEVLNEYNQTKQRDEGYEKELSDLAVAEKSLREIMAELADKIENDFFGGVEKINEEFSKFFVSVFGGGKAELKFVKKEKKSFSDDSPSLSEREKTISSPFFALEEKDISSFLKPEETGIEISVSHPKKRISSLEMLSGGERSLVAISLLFAMSQVNPPPFLILDETDAALDEANSQKYALMLKNLGEKTQLIVITHNRETMRQADIIYGITMSADGISRLLSIKFDDAKDYINQ